MNEERQRFYQSFRSIPRVAFFIEAVTENAKEFEAKFGQVFTIKKAGKRLGAPFVIVSTGYGEELEISKENDGSIHVNGELMFEGGWKDVNTDTKP